MCVSKRSHFEHWKIYWKNVRAFYKHDRPKLKMVGQTSYHPILIILHSALCVHLDPLLSIFLDLPLTSGIMMQRQLQYTLRYCELSCYCLHFLYFWLNKRLFFSGYFIRRISGTIKRFWCIRYGTNIQCIQSEQYNFFIARGRAVVGVPNFSIPFLSSPYSGFQNMTRNC